MPSSPSTLGWSKFSISADLVTNSSISSCEETSVKALHYNLKMATKRILHPFSLSYKSCGAIRFTLSVSSSTILLILVATMEDRRSREPWTRYIKKLRRTGGEYLTNKFLSLEDFQRSCAVIGVTPGKL